MTGQEVARLLSEHIDERFIHPDQPMAEYTSFRTGGNALCVVEVHDLEELRRVLTCVRKKFLPYSILGNGTNTLVEDEGYSGVAIVLDGEFKKIDVTGYEVTCGGGASCSCRKNGCRYVAYRNGMGMRNTRNHRRCHQDECRCLRIGYVQDR